MNKTKGNLVLTGEAVETGWAAGGDRGRLRWLAGGGDRRLWVIGWSWVMAFWVIV